MVRRVGKDNIWQHLPKYFLDRRQELLACTNALVAFIQSEKIKRGKEFYMPYDLFRAAFQVYQAENNMPKQKLTRELFFYPFKQFNVVEDGGNREYNGALMTGIKWLLGIDLNSNNKMEDDAFVG
jgi:hypothetical protein